INRGGEKVYPRDVERQWAAAGVHAVAVAVPAGDFGHEIGAVADGTDPRVLDTLAELPHLRPATAWLAEPITTATGKPRRAEMARGLVAHPHPPDRYAGLLAYALACARRLLDDPARPRTAQACALTAQAALLVARCGSAVPATEPGADRSPAHDALDLLVAHWAEFAAGALTGEELIKRQPRLWTRLMTEWPMGDYARLAADVVRARRLPGAPVLELGTGVGNTTRLLADELGEQLVWSDRSAALVARGGWPGRGLVLDFDAELPPEVGRPGTVFACNALHCSAAPAAALRRLAAALRPGGVLVLGEGATPTHPDGIPWALDYLFCMFDGWWDRSGFRPRSEWLRLISDAGFVRPGYAALRYGRHDCGGVLWAYRPEEAP
ncbi:MAG TPA: class I SAM-dependent methyltransferase, partial [Jatrophihabitans sp.]|nr:class I SAM-dependent methyltransferase [Jatrophihabitans sp.]